MDAVLDFVFQFNHWTLGASFYSTLAARNINSKWIKSNRHIFHGVHPVVETPSDLHISSHGPRSGDPEFLSEALSKNRNIRAKDIFGGTIFSEDSIDSIQDITILISNVLAVESFFVFGLARVESISAHNKKG